MVIAIDGPAGAGKSTVARAVAERLGFTYLDTGAMYRCVALAVSETAASRPRSPRRLRSSSASACCSTAATSPTAIRTPAVSEAASRVSADIGVRMALVRKQQELLRDGDWVAEGRDIGTVVCPDAAGQGVPHRLARGARAAPRRGARRRLRDGARRAGPARRARRAARALAARAANDAVPVDTTELDLEGVLGQILTLVVEAREIEA